MSRLARVLLGLRFRVQGWFEADTVTLGAALLRICWGFGDLCWVKGVGLSGCKFDGLSPNPEKVESHSIQTPRIRGYLFSLVGLLRCWV